MQLKQATQDSLKFVSDCIERNSFSKETKDTVYFAVDNYLASIGVEKFFENNKDYSQYNKDAIDSINHFHNSCACYENFKKRFKKGVRYITPCEFVEYYHKLTLSLEDKISFVREHAYVNPSKRLPSLAVFHMFFEDKEESLNDILKSHGFNENSGVYFIDSHFTINSFYNIYNKLGKIKFAKLKGITDGNFYSSESIIENIDFNQLLSLNFSNSILHMFLLFKENKLNELNKFIPVIIDKLQHHISQKNIMIPFASRKIRYIVFFSKCFERNAKSDIYAKLVKLAIIPENYTGRSFFPSESSLFIFMKSIIDLEINPDSF